MLKLCNLIEQDEMAASLSKYWKLGEDEKNRLFFFRSSSNVVYLLKCNQETYFLRYAPQDEKSKEQIEAEIELILYLREHGYTANEPIACLDGSYIADNGSCYAVLFRAVTGEELDDISLNEEIISGYGISLAKFHQLSKTFKPGHPRTSYEDILTWIGNVLKDDETMLKVVHKVREDLNKIPKNSETFGVCHYDFELDNVFYDCNNGQYEIIDFDDSMYHFYAIDVLKAIQSIQEETDASEHEKLCCAFLTGYQSILPDLDQSLFPYYEHFIWLYSYARQIYSLSGIPKQVPDWMEEIITKFQREGKMLREQLLTLSR